MSSFTLVELLTVLAIMAMLIVLLIPAVKHIRQRAQKTQCQNNLRQYGVAIGQYLADWHGYFLWPGKGSSGTRSSSMWVGGSEDVIRTINPDGSYDPLTWKGTFSYLEGDGRALFGGGALTSIYYLLPSIQDRAGIYLHTGAHTYLYNFIPYITATKARHCPAKDYEDFLPTNSPSFKGYRTETDPLFGEDVLYNDADYSMLTTYAMNSYYYDRHDAMSDIPDNFVAFIDWNAEQGWADWGKGPNLSYTKWKFGNVEKGIVQDEPKGDDWWKTEVGFHHVEEGVAGANYVSMDGHVGWVSSNDIDQSYFQ